MRFRGIKHLSVLPLLLILAGCALGLREPIFLTTKSEVVTLEWDKPVLDVPQSGTEVTSYRIYYRSVGGIDWLLLSEIPASDHPQYIVHFGDLQGEGVYAFAVRAVSADGRQSAFHTSTDLAASPPSGWYLLWMRPK